MGLKETEIANAPMPSDPLPQTAATLASPTAEERLSWIQRALAQRADFLAARQSQVPLRILTRQAESDLKPRLDLSVAGGYAGLDASHSLVSPLSRRLTGGNGSVGLTVDWPAQNSFQRGQLRARRAAERQSELSAAQLQSDIAANVCAALEEVRFRAATMLNAAATSEIARKALDQEQGKLQTGQATVLDVINLQNLLSQARLSEIDARAGYAIAVAQLRFMTGSIFTADSTDHSFHLADLNTPPNEK
jgi:outer membrane protein TolC